MKVQELHKYALFGTNTMKHSKRKTGWNLCKKGQIYEFVRQRNENISFPQLYSPTQFNPSK